MAGTMLTLTFVMMAFIVTSGMRSFPYTDDDLSFETRAADDSVDTMWRSKRINQMACHCCSNSFNSNCCYKCMRSMGKRSQTLSVTHPSRVDRELPKEVLDTDLDDKELSEELDSCLCCTLERQVDSSMSSSTCCALCHSNSFR